MRSDELESSCKVSRGRNGGIGMVVEEQRAKKRESSRMLGDSIF